MCAAFPNHCTLAIISEINKHVVQSCVWGVQASEQEGAGLRTEAQQGGKAQQMQAELQSQAEQKTALKLKQKNAEQEASNVQTPKVCVLPDLLPCLVCKRL